jgi:hypothetical protein
MGWCYREKSKKAVLIFVKVLVLFVWRSEVNRKVEDAAAPIANSSQSTMNLFSTGE